MPPTFQWQSTVRTVIGIKMYILYGETVRHKAVPREFIAFNHSWSRPTVRPRALRAVFLK